MNTPSVDVKDVLVADGLGTFGATTGWSIHISSEPAAPDSTITIYDYNGVDGLLVNPAAAHEVQKRYFQIRVRDMSYPVAYAKCEAVITALQQQAGKFTATGVEYIDVQKVSGPMFLKKDDANRSIVVANFFAMRQQTA